MNYFLGGYYLIRLKELDFGQIKGSKLFTCSNCLNESFLDTWSLSWTVDGMDNLDYPKEKFNLSDIEIKKIQSWADEKFEQNKIGWYNVFPDLEALFEYKSQFFNQEKDYRILSVYLQEEESKELIKEFEPQSPTTGSFGLWDNLKSKKKESENKFEKFIGYDLIGIEFGGGFHSFHCHDLGTELSGKFDVRVNEYGLINNSGNFSSILEFMNDLENGFEPVPWYLAKVKLVDENKYNELKK